MPQPKFPDYFVEGAYRPYDFSIHLAGPAPRAVGGGDLGELRVLAHETQHGLDHAGTPWGLELSRLIFEALGSAAGDEYDWWRLISLHDASRRLSHNSYYTVNGAAVGLRDRRRWAWEFTCGHEYTADGRIDPARPIMFIRFYDAATREIIRRQPLSAVALLEARAIHVELQLLMADPNGALEVGNFVARSYEPGLAEYSALAHLTSSRLNLELVQAYAVAAAAAWYALLQPVFSVDRLAATPWTEILGRARLEAFAATRDPGFLVSQLLQAAPAYSGDIDDWLRRATALAGLPAPADVVEEARRTLAQPAPLEMTVVQPYFDEVARATLSNFETLTPTCGLIGGAVDGPGWERLALADRHYGDGRMIAPPERVLHSMHPHELVEMGREIQGKVDWFLTACR